MVRKIVLSEYSSDPPDQPGRAKIATEGGRPLYGLDRVKALVADETRLTLWTRKCRSNVRALFDNDLEQVADLINALREDDYVDSEWCENGSDAWAACDAYSIRRREPAPVTGKPLTVQYFVKFAIGKTGQLVLLVSCHVS